MMNYVVGSVIFVGLIMLMNHFVLKFPWAWTFAITLIFTTIGSFAIRRYIHSRTQIQVEPVPVNETILHNRPIITDTDINTVRASLNPNPQILQNRPLNDIKGE